MKKVGGEGEGGNGKTQFLLVFFYWKKPMKQTLFWRRQNVLSDPKQVGASFSFFIFLIFSLDVQSVEELELLGSALWPMA